MGCGVAAQQLYQAVAVDLRVRALAVSPELRVVQLGLLTDPGAAFPLTRYALQWRLAKPPAELMPTRRIDQSLRQLFGPPYVLYTLHSAGSRNSAGTGCFWWLVATVAAVTAVLGTCFARPDNDWARTHAAIRRFAKVKRVHGIMMVSSFLCNLLLLLQLAMGW